MPSSCRAPSASQPCATHCKDGMVSTPKEQENLVAAVAAAERPLDGSYPDAQVMAQLWESARRLNSLI